MSMRHRSSSPKDSRNETFTIKDFHVELNLTDNVLLKTGDSTRSLLAPLYDSDAGFDNFSQIDVVSDEENTHEGSERFSPSKSLSSAINSKTVSKSSKKSLPPQSQSKSNLSNCSSNKNSSKRSNGTRVSSSSNRNTGHKSESIRGKDSRKSTISKSLISDQSKRKSRTVSTTSSSSSSSSSSSTPPSERVASSIVYSTIFQDQNKLNETQRYSWEDWLINKTILDIEKLKLKTQETKRIVLEKKLAEEEEQRKHLQALDNREEWLKTKTYQQRKLKKENDAQLEFEKLKKQQQADLIEGKSKEHYEEWHQHLLRKEKEEKAKIKQEKQKQSAENRNKVLQSKEAYENWLKTANKKGKIKRHTYGYSGGSLFSYYDMSATPRPSYSNPVPWVDAILNDCKRKKGRENYASPPMMWQDVEKREQIKKKTVRKKKETPKHSCINLT